MPRFTVILFTLSIYSLKPFTSINKLLALLSVLVEVEPPDGSSAHAHEHVLQAGVVGFNLVAVGIVSLLRKGSYLR
jgi:hypothetical protein